MTTKTKRVYYTFKSINHGKLNDYYYINGLAVTRERFEHTLRISQPVYKVEYVKYTNNKDLVQEWQLVSKQ